MKKQKYSTQGKLIRLLSLVIYTLLISCVNDKENKSDSLKLKIYSPTDCYYTFIIKNGNFHVESFNISYNNQKGVMDTLQNSYDTIFLKKDLLALNSCIKKIKFSQYEIKNVVHNDAYQYELYIEDNLIAAGPCCNKDIEQIFSICLPYITTEKIACSGFFQMIGQE